MWMFYISKILDFFDTITIVLQKKWKQLSFLHVYHHSSVFMFYWLNVRCPFPSSPHPHRGTWPPSSSC